MTSTAPTTSTSTSPSPSPPPSPPPTLSPLERLPTELRLEIYAYLFPCTPVPSQPFAKHSNNSNNNNSDASNESNSTATALLRVNKRIGAEATYALYSRPATFEIKIRPTGIMFCGGRNLVLPTQTQTQNRSSAQTPTSSHPPRPLLHPLLTTPKSLTLTIIAWLQPSMYARTLAHLTYLVALLREAGPGLLRDLHVGLEWHNGSLAFPVRQPGWGMVRGVLGVLVGGFEEGEAEGGNGVGENEKGRDGGQFKGKGDGSGLVGMGIRKMTFGRIAPPRFGFGGAVPVGNGGGGGDGEEAYDALKEEVRGLVLGG